MRLLPWRRRTEERQVISISDPALVEFFGMNRNYAGVSVNESSSLGISAFWRANMLISGTIASLPMRSLREVDGSTQRVGSVLDDPGGLDGIGPTAHEWKETVLLHLLVHGNAFLAHVFNGGGGIAGLTPIHPLAVSIEINKNAIGGRLYRATLTDGTLRDFSMLDMTHIPGPTLNSDGTGRGMSLVGIARNSLGTTIAGDRAAASQFNNGMMLAGLVTPEDDITEDEAKTIKEFVNSNMAGIDNAGEIAVINRKLKFTQLQSTNEDAQFLESRQFQIEEVARWTGVPPHLLMQTEKQTSWGTGVSEQNRGLARYTLTPWTSRIEQRLSRLLPRPRYVEFDFAGLIKPTPEQEIDLLIKQVDAGLITVNEARAIRNMDPIEGGDVLRNSASIDTVEEVAA